MHIPTFQSLVCLSLLSVPYVSAAPLDENLQPRAATSMLQSNTKTREAASANRSQLVMPVMSSL